MLVAMTGGLMAFHKCSWQVLAWMTDKGRMIMRNRDTTLGDIHLSDHRGISSKINFKEHDKPNVGLGFSLVPTGTMAFEFANRLQQAKDCATSLGTATLTTTEAWLALVTRVLPKVTYPFMLTRFSKKQLHRLAIILDNVMLPKLGINRKMKRAVVYAPLELGGIGYPYIGTIQDQKGIGHFVKHLQWGQEIGTEMRALLSHAQVSSGLVTPLMEDTSLHLTYLEEGMISHLRDRLRELKGGIWIENLWVPQLQREKDQSLMEIFMKAKSRKITNKIIEEANICRIYLRIITVAELADLNGREISPHKINGEWRAQSTLVWPTQAKPSDKMWKSFRMCLRATCCKNPKRVLYRKPLPLDQPLGKWLQTDRHLQYQYYRSQEWVYSRELELSTKFMRYTKCTSGHNAFKEDATVNDDLPGHVIPVEAYIKYKFVYPIQKYETVQPTITPAMASNTVETNVEQLRMAEKLIAVSDGSLDPISGRAAYSWVITSMNRIGSIKRSLPVRANPKYITSYRAELAGVTNLLGELVQQKFDQPINLWCDNEGVVKMLSKKTLCLTDLTSAEGDLLKVARKHLNSLPNITILHVDGHQEDETPYDLLPIEAQLNCDCDHEAKECMRNYNEDGNKAEPTPGSGAALYLNNDLVTTKMDEQIQYAAHAGPMLEYIQQKFEWTHQQTDGINWKGIRLAKRRLKRHESIRTSKMMHDWLNVGKQKGYMKQETICPCCGTEEEDTIHLYHCQHEEMRTAVEEGITTMEKAFHNAHLPAATYIAFIDMIRLATHSTRQRKQYNCIEAEHATHMQETLGTFAILRGHHHTQWAHACQNTFRKPPCPPGKKPPRYKSALEMSVLLIEQCWQFFEKIWSTRNNILHGKDSYSAKAEESRLFRELMDYKRRQHILLHHGDTHHICFPVGDIVAWDRKRKRRVIRLLRSLHRIFVRDSALAAENQKRLTDYGFEIIPRDEDTESSIT